MSAIDEPIDARPPQDRTMLGHVKGIIMQPRSEWLVIDGESTTVSQLYMSYIVPLSAIPPIASFIGMSIFGMSIPFIGTYRIPMGSALTMAIVQYVLGLVGVYILALIVDGLAPSFDGQKNQVQAFKVIAYSMTASWLAGIFALIPGLRILSILGLYGLYLLYLGLPPLMRSPKEKAVGYTVVTIVCAIVIYIVIGAVGSHFVSYPAMGAVR